jgi:hypothetical protein
MAQGNNNVGAFSEAALALSDASLSVYGGATTLDEYSATAPTAPILSGVYVYDPVADTTLGDWGNWSETVSAFGGSDQSVFDLGTPTRRWRTIYTDTGVDVLSDGDRKRFIRNCELGVGFLMRLRPVSFSWKKGAPGTFHGFIGQEVAEATEGLPFSGVIKSDGGYSLRYTELIAPLVKAVQEQHTTITSLKDEIAVLRSRLDILAAAIG